MRISFDFDATTRTVSNITVDGAGGVVTPPTPAGLLIDNGDGTVTLTKTGHRVPKPQPENGEIDPDRWSAWAEHLVLRHVSLSGLDGPDGFH